MLASHEGAFSKVVYHDVSIPLKLRLGKRITFTIVLVLVILVPCKEPQVVSVIAISLDALVCFCYWIMTEKEVENNIY